MASELIAYCGLYCGACSFRLASEENNRDHLSNMPAYYNHIKNNPLEYCPGCRLENKCGECFIRDCAINKKINSCNECNLFPCDNIIRFNNDGKLHHNDAIKNLELLTNIGEEKWLVYMSNKWTCNCGRKKSWYYKSCNCP